VQYRTLTHLNLDGNKIRSGGTESLAGILAQCPVLTHLDLSKNAIGNSGSERLVGVLTQCIPDSPQSRVSTTIASVMPEHKDLQNPGVDQKVNCF
jgi:hypothetical protein